MSQGEGIGQRGALAETDNMDRRKIAIKFLLAESQEGQDAFLSPLKMFHTRPGAKIFFDPAVPSPG